MADDISRTGAPARVRDRGPGELQVEIEVGGQHFVGDEPVSAGGTGTGPAPHELLAAALAECTVLTLRLYADRKAWPLERVEVEVIHEVQTSATPRDLFRRRIELFGPLDEQQSARLMDIAERCPVHKTLTAGSRIETAAVT
ncbi:MAG: OsmC family protein [Caulobacteraceae bacterium]